MIVCMCQLCDFTANDSRTRWSRRGWLLATTSLAASPALAQVSVGESSRLRNLIPAEDLEAAATKEYGQLIAQARAKGVLVAENHPSLQRLRAIVGRLIPHALRWNDRAKTWRWEVNLINADQVNAFVMPGGKIAMFTGLLDKLRLTEDEAAMVIAHEMAHALREHARERIAKTQGTGIGLSVLAQVLGLGQFGDMAANVGTQLLTLRFSREDETEADLVGLEIAARAGYNPNASVSLWDKMNRASGGSSGPAFMSTHPSGEDRMRRLRENIPRVQGLYQQAIARGVPSPAPAAPAVPPDSGGIRIIR
jgi:predicted Zn-dependent protease